MDFKISERMPSINETDPIAAIITNPLDETINQSPMSKYMQKKN